MILAWKELKYNWKKYLLIEIIVVLMMFMVLFLSGLVQGLGRAVSSGVENMNAEHFVLSDDAEKLITVSNLTTQQSQKVKDTYGKKATSIDIARMYLQKENDDEKIDVTYFAIDPSSYLNVDVYKGNKLSHKTNTIVLDDDYESKGIKLNDTVKDANSGIAFKVVGFTKDAMYGHVSVAYISTNTYRAIMKEANPMFNNTVHAYAIKGSAKQTIKGTKTYTKQEIIKSLPGYQAEQMTITMVQWLLVVITAFIIGIFFFIINLQKEKEFGVLKAIGTRMSRLVRFILSQVCIISVGGALIAGILVLLMSQALPAAMPFFLVPSQVLLVLAAFILISILGSLATVVRVAKIDPAKIIGGDFE